MSSDGGNKWTEWQCQLPHPHPGLTKENPPCPEGFHCLGISEVVENDQEPSTWHFSMAIEMW